MKYVASLLLFSSMFANAQSFDGPCEQFAVDTAKNAYAKQISAEHVLEASTFVMGNTASLHRYIVFLNYLNDKNQLWQTKYFIMARYDENAESPEQECVLWKTKKMRSQIINQ